MVIILSSVRTCFSKADRIYSDVVKDSSLLPKTLFEALVMSGWNKLFFIKETDSSIMNLGNSAASFTESESDFVFFYLEKP